MRQNQRDRLRMFVDDEREEILTVDILQKAERDAFDRLANVVDRRVGVLAQRFFDQRLGDVEAARAATDRLGIGFREFLNDGGLLISWHRTDLGNLDRDRFELFWLQLAEKLRG